MIKKSKFFLAISMVYFFMVSCSSPTSTPIEDNENLHDKLQPSESTALVLATTTPVIKDN